ncbi:hypothetical protein [uncultured Phenylobacterium sp.]|uniref:hypothetical protein n=1 Tax=uncultured Phenylobacterium sp. TaxID=349273 RepID=UPI0025E75F69|nr:hypothetical protein [uncultured Phenylobacterium sp.]
MLRIAPIAAAVLLTAAPAWTQVLVTTLPSPDAFSTAGRDTGLPAELWRGTPIETARMVLPVLAAKPLSPAATALALRVLATGATGPEGAVGDEALVGARAGALLALGDVAAASRILEREPGVERNAELARAAAESALLAGDNTRACALAEGRTDTYWLRLRAFCQAEAGRMAEAQLTFDLAQSQGRDATFARLLSARLAKTPPGAASLRGGLDFALSKALNLDLAVAKPAPAVAAAISGAPPPSPTFDVSAIDGAIGGLAPALAAGPPPVEAVSALIAAAAEADAKTRARLQGAALLVAALVPELSGADRTRLAGFAVPEGKGPVGRSLSLDAAADGGRMGELALLALWTCADAGTAGPALGDRVRIVRALARVGLMDEARAFALEGLAGLK